MLLSLPEKQVASVWRGLSARGCQGAAATGTGLRLAEFSESSWVHTSVLVPPSYGTVIPKKIGGTSAGDNKFSCGKEQKAS